MFNISIPLWTLWFIPIILGSYLIKTAKDTGGYFNFPEDRAWVGCGINIATILIAIGFYLARLF